MSTVRRIIHFFSFPILRIRIYYFRSIRIRIQDFLTVEARVTADIQRIKFTMIEILVPNCSTFAHLLKALQRSLQPKKTDTVLSNFQYFMFIYGRLVRSGAMQILMRIRRPIENWQKLALVSEAQFKVLLKKIRSKVQIRIRLGLKCSKV
jgi:hypothetical protein